VQLRMIVIRLAGSDSDKTLKKQQAETLRRKAVAGEDFASLAKSFSEDVQPEKGGDLGWVEYGELKTEVANAASKTSAGGICPVVEAGDTLFVVKVEARREASVIPFEEARVEIEQQLRQQTYERLYNSWIAKLRRRAYVRISDGGKPSQ